MIYLFPRKLKENIRFELTARGSLPSTFHAYLAAAISVEQNQAAVTLSRSQPSSQPPPRLPPPCALPLPAPPSQQMVSKHMGHVRSILQVLRDHKLYAKVQKCDFNRDQKTFVGYMVSPLGIGMDPAKVTSILEWPIPKFVKEVQSFLGFANIYGKFIQSYSSLATPLTTLTKKSMKIT